MTDWIKHDGGPQPVADDVEIEVSYRRMLSPCKQVGAARFRNWKHNPEKPKGDIIRYRILNQHLIDAARKEGLQKGLEAFDEARLAVEGDIQKLCDAARLEGIRLGLEAAGAHLTEGGWVPEIRALDPETIAREAADKETAR